MKSHGQSTQDPPKNASNLPLDVGGTQGRTTGTAWYSKSGTPRFALSSNYFNPDRHETSYLKTLIIFLMYKLKMTLFPLRLTGSLNMFRKCQTGADDRPSLNENGLVESPCSPRDSQESSPTPQFKSINSLALSLLHSPTLTSIHDHWKNRSLD